MVGMVALLLVAMYKVVRLRHVCIKVSYTLLKTMNVFKSVLQKNTKMKQVQWFGMKAQRNAFVHVKLDIQCGKIKLPFGSFIF